MSKFCNNCGTEIQDDYMMFCPDCGAKQEQPASGGFGGTQQPHGQPQSGSFGNNAQSYGAPPPQQYGGQPYGGQPYGQQINIMQPNTQVTTGVGGWIGWIVLASFLPLIGLIIALCVSQDESVKNWAKAQLVVAAIVIVLYVLLYVAVGTSLSSM